MILVPDLPVSSARGLLFLGFLAVVVVGYRRGVRAPSGRLRSLLLSRLSRGKYPFLGGDTCRLHELLSVASGKRARALGGSLVRRLRQLDLGRGWILRGGGGRGDMRLVKRCCSPRRGGRRL